MLAKTIEFIRRTFLMQTPLSSKGLCEALQQGWTLALRLNDRDLEVDLDSLVTARFTSATEEAANLRRAYARLRARAQSAHDEGHSLDPAWEIRMMSLDSHIQDIVCPFLNDFERQHVMETQAYEPEPFRRLLMSPEEVTASLERARIERAQIEEAKRASGAPRNLGLVLVN